MDAKAAYRVKKMEQEVDTLKRKAAARDAEYLALQTSVSNAHKARQQRINRQEQEILELRRARDVLTADYQRTLAQVIALGKETPEGRAASLAASVEALSAARDAALRERDLARNDARDATETVVALQGQLALAHAERDAIKRSAADAEAAHAAAASSAPAPPAGPLELRVVAVWLGRSVGGAPVCRALLDAGARVVLVGEPGTAAAVAMELPSGAVVVVVECAAVQGLDAALLSVPRKTGWGVAVQAVVNVAALPATEEWDAAAEPCGKALLQACKTQRTVGVKVIVNALAHPATSTLAMSCARTTMRHWASALAAQWQGEARINTVAYKEASPGALAQALVFLITASVSGLEMEMDL